MIGRHPLKTSVLALLGITALAPVAQVQAEGGEAPSLVSPWSAGPAQLQAASASEDTEEATAAGEAQIEGTQPKKPAGGGTKAAAATGRDTGVASMTAGSDVQRPTLRGADAVRANAVRPLIARYASENGLPFELADAVVRIESRYNAGARNGVNLGLTQVSIHTARSLGYTGDAAGLLDAETNLRFGLKYLAQAYKLASGDTCGTILRYQFGHRTKTMTAASRAYCAKVKVITASAD